MATTNTTTVGIKTSDATKHRRLVKNHLADTQMYVQLGNEVEAKYAYELAAKELAAFGACIFSEREEIE